jgi:protease-4
MNKNPLLHIFFILTFVSLTKAQDFNLYTPSNEMYLFSAYDEGANAFRYNPAVLGLRHKLNFTLNAFIENRKGKIKVSEGDFLLNLGNFGFGYRNSSVRLLANALYPTIAEPRSFANVLHTFNFAFGAGSKTITAGLLFQHSVTKSDSYLNQFQYGLESKSKISIAILYRPFSFISTAFVYKSGEAVIIDTETANKYTIGAAIRPLNNDMLTLMADFSFIPYNNSKFFGDNIIKAGFDIKPYKGIHINGNYTQINSLINYNSKTYNSINIGIGFEFPNAFIRYNNNFSRNNRDGYYSNDYPWRSNGSHISLSFNLERRESIISPPKHILEISLSGSLQDYNTSDILFGILGDGKRSIHEVIADIDYAAKDESVSGLLLKIYPLATGRFEITANMEELGAALERFKKSGKKITAYLPENTQAAEYYIASFANNIVMPEEAIFYYGLSIDVTNYKQFLQKYGIELQTFYAGKYKLTFQGLLDSTTEEGKEVINRMLDIIYDKMLKRITDTRKISLDDYMRTKLSQPISGREAKRLGLIDINGWFQDAKDIAEKNSNTSSFTQSLNRSEWDYTWSEPDQIAIIGVYGSITEGESEAPPIINIPIPFLSGGRSTGSETVVSQLEDAFSNPRVKAVILRIESGGGSALASAEINAAIIRLKKKYNKPFIVSMGGAAASGGYYISVNGDKIFASETTVTGSIGVFGAIPNLDSLLEQQKIKVETFKRGEYSDIISITKKLNKDEIDIIQGLIDFYYEKFVGEIVDARKLTKDEVEKIAQGRVWMGTDAYNKKLIDEIGGLYDAVNYAKKKSGIGKRFKLVYYAVPGGNTISQIVSSSVLKYLEYNLLNLTGFGDEEDGLEIKY